MGKNNLISVYGTNEKGLRLCSQCLIYKEPINFYKSDKYPDGKMYKCKICFQEYRTKTKAQRKQERMEKIKLNTLPDVQMAKMTQCSKEDYELMYEFLNRVGYDPTKNIAKQFAEKWGVKYKERRPQDHSYYLSNGKKNPLHRTWKGDE
jgi:uncharacterized protein (DUF1919 family)